MIRPAAMAGEFYPENKKELEKMIDGFLSEAEPPEIKGEIFGLLLPHASYSFSGRVAADGFKVIAGQKFDTAVIIGDSHYERFGGVAVWAKGEWKTPLGKVKTDEDLSQKIISGSARFFRRDSAHLWEHSAETHLPFLQKTLKNFKILPIVFGSENKDWKLLAETILKNIKNRKVLIIASADLSHYLSYQKAGEADKKTLESVLSRQTKNLNVCAIDSVKTIIEITKQMGGRAELLKYLNSGDITGDKTRVVGYGAVVFYKK